MNHCHDCNSDYSAPGTCNCFAPGGKRAPAQPVGGTITTGTITTTVLTCPRCGYVHGTDWCPLSPGTSCRPYTWISLPQVPADAVTVYLSDNSQPPPAP